MEIILFVAFFIFFAMITALWRLSTDNAQMREVIEKMERTSREQQKMLQPFRSNQRPLNSLVKSEGYSESSQRGGTREQSKGASNSLERWAGWVFVALVLYALSQIAL